MIYFTVFLLILLIATFEAQQQGPFVGFLLLNFKGLTSLF